MAPRAPIINGTKGAEESRPIHARDVELMLNDFINVECTKRWDPVTNSIVDVVSTLQGAPAGRDGHSRNAQPMGVEALEATPGRLPPRVSEAVHSDAIASDVQHEAVTHRRRGWPRQERSSLLSTDTSYSERANISPRVTEIVQSLRQHVRKY